MNIYIYAKTIETISTFEEIIDIIKNENDDIFIAFEDKRSFRKLEEIKKENKNNIYIVNSLNSLGLNDAEISNQLSWFVDTSTKLIICEIPSTYEFGISQPLNQAILSTLLHSILNNNKNVITVSFKKNNSGRNKLPFPDNWDELYNQWMNKEITSKDFIEKSNLKKATFYNLLTEYKQILSANKQYIQKYKII